ncbi:MAG: serine/threonine-protein phosphatase [Clostridia bacterium]|nr:serine/threonine-protein phosphatase [Clostridia bacterium]
MIRDEDEYQVYDINDFIEVAVLSLKGNRSCQEDRVGFALDDAQGMIVLCDGMGGHEGGKMASTIAVEEFLAAYRKNPNVQSVREFLLGTIEDADQKVSRIQRPDGTMMRAGSTVAAIYVRENQLFWVAAGDSRIYILRNQELVQVTKDHTYQMILDTKWHNGEISLEKYQSEMKRKHMLISFLGVGGLPYVENNKKPLQLLPNDRIVLVSDGIYKLYGNDELIGLFRTNDCRKIFHCIQEDVRLNQQRNLDNLSMAIIKVK